MMDTAHVTREIENNQQTDEDREKMNNFASFREAINEYGSLDYMKCRFFVLRLYSLNNQL